MQCTICNETFETYEELTRHLVKIHNFKINEVYNYYNFSTETREATCPICGTKFKLDSRQIKKWKEGISKGTGCCRKCGRKLMDIVFGNPSTWDSVKQKKKETNLKNWGVENVFQAKEIKEQLKKTNLEKYGVEYVMQSSQIKEKSKNTNIKKYGVEHVSQREDIKKKKIQKSIEKYGVENVSQAQEVKDKKKQKSIEKYNVPYTLQAEEVREKIKETSLEKYGTEFTTQAEEVKEHIKEANLKKYGYAYAGQVPEVKEKAKETNLKKYGVPYSIMSEEVKEKIKETNLERYGVNYFCQHEKCINASYSRISKVNKKFHELLESQGIKNTLEFIIDDFGYDIKVNNTLIEINPYFTHNTTVGPCFGGEERESISKDYHLIKTDFAKKHGFNCIHIFDWDNKDKVIFLLKQKEKIQGRKCNVKELDRKIVDEFLGKYHLQGANKGVKFAYGLYYENELVEVMTFGKPRYNKNYEYELLRLCTKFGISVIGGANKLLKYFEEKVNPKSIISYCDLSKFSGDVYEKLGFKLTTQTEPAKHWYNPKTKRHITDNLLRQKGFDILHNANYGKGTSNEELMKEYGYVEIYDCGQLVFTKEF